MTKPRYWLSSPIERDLLAYLGHEGVGYALRKHCIERYECDPLLGRGYQYVGVEKDAPPKVLEHWRRLGGCEVVTPRKPKLLDLFCCAGGAGMGYHRAGFDVTGVDIAPQKNYPFKFIQADALDYLREHGHEYDVIHASPPCQLHSSLKNLFVNKPDYQQRHIDLIPQTRELLEVSGKPYVIENVVGSPLRNPIMLCGSQFNLKVYRHRLFESSVMLFAPNHAPHNDKMKSASVSPKGFITVGGDGGLYGLPEGVNYMEYASAAMGIDWMSRMELSQSIPPAYTEYIGKQLMQSLSNRKQLTLFDAA